MQYRAIKPVGHKDGTVTKAGELVELERKIGATLARHGIVEPLRRQGRPAATDNPDQADTPDQSDEGQEPPTE